MSLEDINGIGKKTLTYLNNLGIYNIDDLVTYYPYRYDIIKRSNLDTIKENDKIIIDGVIENIPTIYYYGKRKNVMNFRINTGSIVLLISIYNRAFLKNKLKVGEYVTVIGKYIKGKVIASDLKLSRLSNETKVEIIYHGNNKINSSEINKYILNGLLYYQTKDIIPLQIKDNYNFLNRIDAINEIHKPTSSNKLKSAINTLKYEEIFLFMLKIYNLKKNRKNIDGISRNINKSEIDKFISTLPFELTVDQIKATNDIYEDLISKNRMNRLIQGDVGSGKTIVAIIALYINYLSGYQGALMAPTEVLATQHFENIKKYIKGANIEILSGSTKKSEKKKIVNRLQNKEIDILIGTHSLFSDDVIYNNLGLVITDEQHRFGVNQRASLKNKGITPDILYLSATPIPRTYALTIYGDMDISNIKTIPSGKKEIITILKKNSEIKDVLQMMLDEIKKKHQIYVIAPLAIESDNTDLEDVNALYEKMNKALGKVCKIGLMTGKMNSKDKDEVMDKFKNKEIDILVSTTVIEVGVDVKNATMIVIFDSFQFGLSTLHQLRGRVGRNDMQSYCILISDKEVSRLKIMTSTTDGFKISEEDFNIRGSGDLFGIKQSGDMAFKLANIKRDYQLFLKVKEDINNYLKNNNISDELKNILNKYSKLD